MVVRMDGRFRAELAAEHLNSTVRNHFVDVHVRLSSGAGLPHDQWKVII